MNRKYITAIIFAGVIVFGVFLAIKKKGFLPTPELQGVFSPSSTSRGITLLNSPTSNITVLEPLSINGADGLISNILWDSGVISLASPVTLADEDGVYIHVEFSDPVLMKMADTTGVSSEIVTVELFGTVITPDIAGGLTDTVKFELYFPEAEEFQSFPIDQVMSISSASGSGAFEQAVQLTETQFHFGGFTLNIFQNGTGEVEINQIRVAVKADSIIAEPIGTP